MVQCFDGEGDKERAPPNLYCDTYERFLLEAIERLTENVRVDAEFWPGEDLCIAPSQEIVKL